MLIRVSLATVKARPTNRKIKKSVCSAQRTVNLLKKDSSATVKPIMTGISDTLGFIKEHCFKQAC